MTGAFVRVKRNDKMENVEVEYLSVEERVDLFKDRDKEEILRWLDLTCSFLCEFEEVPKEEAESINDNLNDLIIEEEPEATIMDNEGNIL